MKRFIAFGVSVFFLALATVPMQVHALDGNLLANASVETAASGKPISWIADSWGSNTATLTYKNGGAHTGSRSLYASISRYTNGDAKWYAAPIPVTPGAQYVYTDWYKASVKTEMMVKFIDENNTPTYRWFASAPRSTVWKQASITLVSPAGTTKVTVFHLLNARGNLEIDDMSLTQKASAPAISPVPPALPPASTPSDATPTNLVPNASLEITNGSLPQDWQSASAKTNTANFSYLPTGRTGNHSLKIAISSYTSGDAYWSFTPQSVTGGKIYEFSNWYQSDVNTDVYADITMNDGGEQWMYIGTAYHSGGWNHFDQQFTMPIGAKTITLYQSLASVGYLITDDYQLTAYTPIGFNRPLVSITFDDSLKSQYTYGLPIMQKYGFKTTQYFLTGFIDDPYYMTKTMMQAFKADGHEIGSHSITHSTLTDISATQLDSELQQSQSDLLAWLGAKPTDFATPHGAYNSDVLTAIKKYYRSHRSVDVGFNSKDNFDIYNIKVQNILLTTTAAEITQWVNQAKADHTWLVLVYHSVTPGSAVDANWNTPPADLDNQFGIIKASGVPVLTVSQALDEIAPQL